MTDCICNYLFSFDSSFVFYSQVLKLANESKSRTIAGNNFDSFRNLYCIKFIDYDLLFLIRLTAQLVFRSCLLQSLLSPDGNPPNSNLSQKTNGATKNARS